MDTTAFLSARKALAEARADEIAREHFAPDDILVMAVEPFSTSPGYALNLARSIAKRVTNEVWKAATEAGTELRLDKEQGRDGAGGAA